MTGIIAAVFPLLLKILEYILDSTKMSREQKKSFVEFVRVSQAEPQESARLFKIVEAQEKELKEMLNKLDKNG